jgi:hypothetical protein
MVNVFSFVIYGNEKKYTQGLLANIHLIQSKFPSWKIWIYYGSDVDNSILSEYSNYTNISLIPTNNTGYITKFYRYLPIDDNSVDICIIRDADSRVNDRDEFCINQFLNSEKLFHIIRDHPNHKHKIMAGMWGIKKGALSESINDLFTIWKQNYSIDFWSDTNFLINYIYPKVQSISLVHDDYNHFHDSSISISYIKDNKHFIGQVYEYDENGEEYPKFTA